MLSFNVYLHLRLIQEKKFPFLNLLCDVENWQTGNLKKPGCYNLQCPGFVQTSKVQYLGGRFDRTSIVGGEMIEITLSITQVISIP